MLNITKYKENGALTLSLNGRLDTTTAPGLEEELKNSIDGVSALTIDLRGLEYISSAGLRVLLSAQKRTAGKMKIRNANETVTEIFDITGFSEILTIE